MIVIGLLLVALVCLVLGLVLASAAWLIASLIASAGAGYLLWKMRASLGLTSTGSSGRAAEPGAETAAPAEQARPADTDGDMLVFGGAAGSAEAVSASDEVWVIDGRPRYHLADCAIIKGQDAEPIPFEQATEDGFMPCSLCEPNAARTG